MATVELTWNGDAYLARVEKDVQALIRRYAYLIEQEAKRLCPVDTGNLRSTIRTELEEFAGAVVVGADYAAFVELGTHDSPAQPYLFPAWEMYREAFIRDLQNVLT